jgi:hypothetical protein
MLYAPLILPCQEDVWGSGGKNSAALTTTKMPIASLDTVVTLHKRTVTRVLRPIFGKSDGLTTNKLV